ncbi:MAG TPA: 2-C-methyl-D-erythritol 4-phosphate cytidylyltransferase [Planctomycetaceae bacterium]|nr:2-C-methyl-D-erythritol 4-phosphate cytidylyltransferase [Planctomycetaceae bacterium]
MAKFAVILAAAGASSRFGDPNQKKVYALIGDKPLWMFSAELFSNHAEVAQVLLVIAPDDREYFEHRYAASAALLGIEIVHGGAQRADSVLNGLRRVKDEIDFVAVHDAARPCVTDDDVSRVFAAAKKSGAAILATKCHSTVKRGDASGNIQETVPRDDLWLAQTPQVFRKDVIEDAFAKHSNPSLATDEASLIEAAGGKVALVEGHMMNIKVTTKADLKFAAMAVKSKPKTNPFPF